MLRLRRLTPHDWQIFREIRLAALAEAPHAYSSTLAQWQGENDVEQRWRKRLADVPYNAIVYLDDVAAGVAGATSPNDDGTIELISMWVAPFARGKGVGDELIRAVIEYAGTIGIQSVSVRVRETNAAARAAYARNGFLDAGPVEGEDPPERRMILTFAS